ncbi:DegT/DnrJ/EryC1/StrS family aminotransferase [Orenia marismortui]|uniref:DegT/DnrJ/EryC1/StrS family aminotransferase n=1 Tax=Orenia marismortui TaxID=46469 RepID=UPI00036AE51B|nr:DegT/DnrJ/EryC1/StrS family aminotransferase [Orenia marismortui]
MSRIKESILVTKPFLPPIEEYYEAMKDIWSSKWLTNNGPKHKKFERCLEDHLEVDNLSLFVNGTLALDLAIKALDLDGEVITTPFTFAATSHVIVSNGLIPVFCDIELNTFNIDPEKIESLITEKTSAILAVHIFGNPANVQKIEEIANKYNLKVIYDAAQAFGVEINGESIANFGYISMFSLHATKVFNSIEGGVLTYKDVSLKEKLELLRNFGYCKGKGPQLVGTNAKMNEFQAIMGLLNLNYYQQEIEKRKDIAKQYREKLKDISGISYLKEQDNIKYNYAYFPIIVTDEFHFSRDELFEKLIKNNIYTKKYYTPLCSNYDSYRDKDILKGHLTNANFLADRVLSLPIYGDLTNQEVDYICNCIFDLSS